MYVVCCFLSSGVNQNDTMHCHRFIARLFLKQFGSNHVSCALTPQLKEISSTNADWKLQQDLLHDSPT